MRRLCRQCASILALYDRNRGDLGLSQFLDLFIASGVPREKIEAVLAFDADGTGSLADRITADMANRLLADMGVSTRQTAAEVRRLRESGGSSAATTRPSGDVGPPRRSR